jgi:hypothetical protein
MKNPINLFLFATILLFASSCKKDAVQLSDRDKFIGTYTGTTTTMLVADNEIIDYDIVATTNVIEKGFAEDQIIVGRGSDYQYNTSVDGTIFLIPGHKKHILIGSDGIEFDVPLLGQGILSQEKELTITSSGEEKYEDIVFKWTIIEKLTKDGQSNP